MSEPLSVIRTLWAREPIRCVLRQQLHPPVTAVQVFAGTRALYTELVNDTEEARQVAAVLWAVFIDRTA
jgi:hypothetical protein